MSKQSFKLWCRVFTTCCKKQCSDSNGYVHNICLGITALLVFGLFICLCVFTGYQLTSLFGKNIQNECIPIVLEKQQLLDSAQLNSQETEPVYPDACMFACFGFGMLVYVAIFLAGLVVYGIVYCCMMIFDESRSHYTAALQEIMVDKSS